MNYAAQPERTNRERICNAGRNGPTRHASEQLGCTDVLAKIKNLIAHWKQFAGLHIEEKHATDRTLDRTAAAKVVFAELQLIEYFLALAERNAEKVNLYVVTVYHALLLASYAHQLAIIDNENPIVAWA